MMSSHWHSKVARSNRRWRARGFRRGHCLIAHEWADTFTRGGFNTGNSPCADDAVVIDDLPPHVWQGSGACSKWYKALSARRPSPMSRPACSKRSSRSAIVGPRHPRYMVDRPLNFTVRRRSRVQAHCDYRATSTPQFHSTIQGHMYVYPHSYLSRTCARMLRAQLHGLLEHHDCHWIRVVWALRFSRKQLGENNEATGERQVCLRAA